MSILIYPDKFSGYSGSR